MGNMGSLNWSQLECGLNWNVDSLYELQFMNESIENIDSLDLPGEPGLF